MRQLFVYLSIKSMLKTYSDIDAVTAPSALKKKNIENQ